MIPTARDRGSVRSSNEGINFFVVEERDQRSVESLRWDCQDPLDEGAVIRMSQGGEAEH
jgi:hypothetical protein